MSQHTVDAIPIGEGWARSDATHLLHGPSQIYFAQQGAQRGKYLVKGDDGKLTVCAAPHSAAEAPVEAFAAGCSAVLPAAADENQTSAPSRSMADADRKLERIVVIADMPKTARLALRFPLGFVDSPASMYVLFGGLRSSSAAAHWCATQFHQRLLPEIAKHIHGWWDAEGEMPEELFYRGEHVASLAKVLKSVLEALDKDLLAGQHCYAGCDAAIAVVIGENMVVACAGNATATLLLEGADAFRILRPGALDEDEEEDEDEKDGGAQPDNGEEQTKKERQTPKPPSNYGHASASGAYLSREGLLCRAKSAWDARVKAAAIGTGPPEEDVARILRAPDAFSLLGIAPGATLDGGVAEVRGLYKKLALRVHPDKVRNCDPVDANVAFERLGSASRAVEAFLEKDRAACRELARLLQQADPFLGKGAATLLQVESDAEEKVIKKAAESLKTKLTKLQELREGEAELRKGLAAIEAAAGTLLMVVRGSAPSSAGERLLAEGVPAASLSGLGMRDLRGVGGGLVVKTSSWRLGESMRLALCVGASAALSAAELQESAPLFVFHPRASASVWAARALAAASTPLSAAASAAAAAAAEEEEGASGSGSVADPAAPSSPAAGSGSSVAAASAATAIAAEGAGKARPVTSASVICAAFREREEDEDINAFEDSRRPAKKAKTQRGPKSIRVRHLLLRCAEAGKPLPNDASARRSRPPGRRRPEGAPPRTLVEAESEAVGFLKAMLELREGGKDDNAISTEFRKLCQQHSECASAENAGQLCGDLGWISRGQSEAAFDQAAFSLRKFEFSDVVATSRGMHIIQRLA